MKRKEKGLVISFWPIMAESNLLFDSYESISLFCYQVNHTARHLGQYYTIPMADVPTVFPIGYSARWHKLVSKSSFKKHLYCKLITEDICMNIVTVGSNPIFYSLPILIPRYFWLKLFAGIFCSELPCFRGSNSQ